MPRSGKAQEADNALVHSYTSVRRALGILGLALPPLLLLVVAVTGQAAQSSISAYYYGPGGNILVGTLCAMAVSRAAAALEQALKRGEPTDDLLRTLQQAMGEVLTELAARRAGPH